MAPTDRARSLSPLALLLWLLSAATAGAMPILMDRYNEHAQSLPQHRDNCVICHVNADGSGELTSFGEKYDRQNLEFTLRLVREYPNLFQVEGASQGAGPAVADAGSAVPAVPGNEPFDAKAFFLEECAKCHGKYGDGDPFQGVPAFATTKWLEERSELTEELLRIILYGKDKMVGQAGRITRDEAAELLDIIRRIARKYS